MVRRVALLGAGVVSAGVGAAVLVQSQAGTAGGALPYMDVEAVARGQEVYAENCASCHGAQLEGEPDWRQRDADGFLPAPPHDVSGHTWHHPDGQLVAITALGTEKIVGGGYKSRMPGFADTLSEDDILAVLAFIKSTWPSEVIARHNQINANAGG